MRDCLDEGMLQSYFDGELSTESMADVSVHLASCLGCTRALREIESENLILSEALAPEFAQAVPTERLRHGVDAAIAGLHVVKPSRAEGIAPAGGTPALPGVRGLLQALVDLITVSPQRAFGYAGLAAVLVLAAIVGIVQLRRAPVAGIKTEIAQGNNNNATAPGPTIASAGLPQDRAAAPAVVDEPVHFQKAGYNPSSEPIRKAQQPQQVKLLPGERSYLKQIASLDTTLNAAGNQPMRPGLQAEYERNLALVNRAIAATRSAAKNNPHDPDAAEFMFAAYQSKVDLLNQVAEARLTNRLAK